MNPATWTKDSDKFGYSRSPQLKAVDQALSAYAGGKSKQSLYVLVDAFLDWYESKVNWLASRRRAHMIELVNYIKQEAVLQVPGIGGYVFNRRMARRRLDEMLATPEAFLRKHRISIAGDRDAAPLDFRVAVDSSDLLFDNGQLGPAPLSAPIVGYKFSSRASLYGPKVPCVCIKMHQDYRPTSSAADALGKLYPVNAGQVMMTGTLTGCSFLIRTAGPLACTHIQPVGQGGNALQDQLEGFGMPGIRVYGLNDYGGLYTHIIGFNIGGWKIYSQRSDAQGKVHTVDTIYP